MSKTTRVANLRGEIVGTVQIVNGDGTFNDLAIATQADAEAGTSGAVLAADARPIATNSAAGVVELATDAETITGTDAARAVTPAGLTARTATTGRTGIAELSTDAEAKAEAAGTVLTASNLRQGAAANANLAAAFAQHYQIAPDLGTATYVHAAVNLLPAAQDVATAITNPDYPRVVSVKGNLAGVAGNVVITGTNMDDDAITDTIALNAATEVFGVKAFKTVTNINLPAQTHTATAQVETATGSGDVTNPGDAEVIVTAAGMAGSPKTYACPVTNGDPTHWVPEVLAVLQADAALTVLYNVEAGATADKIKLTRVAPAADDVTLNIAIATGTATGINAAPNSANTTAGVPYDTVSVGVGNIFGMPHIVAYAAFLLVKLFNGSTDAGSLAVDADEIEKNLYTLAGTPDGAKLVDLVYLV